jgi:hypothetical protein
MLKYTWHFELFLQSTVDLTTVTLHLYHATRIGSSKEATTVTSINVLYNCIEHNCTLKFCWVHNYTIVSQVLMSCHFFIFNNYFKVNLKFEVILLSKKSLK